MSPKKQDDHIHKYKKFNMRSHDKTKEPYWIYKCIKPTCNHYVTVDKSEGRLCECWRCGEPMVISKTVLTGSSMKPMTKPHCPDCLKRKKVSKDDVAAIADFLSGNKT